MTQNASTFDQIRLAIDAGGSRKARLERIAEAIRAAGRYRWVGIYEVMGGEVAAIAWSGPGPPLHLRFPVTQGLCGDAVRRGQTVLVPDVTKDARYLTTFGSTRSEIVVPILDVRTRRALGTVDVESQKSDAFGEEDRAFLERCAAELAQREFSG